MRAFLALAGVVMFATTLRGEVRQPAVAGQFYPDKVKELKAEVAGFLRDAPPTALAPVAVIVPHAGYVFSGATAGKAFGALAGRKYARVIVLGPSHHAGFEGGALPDRSVTSFATPLGEMPVDRDAVERLRKQRYFDGPTRAHAPEHCLEVELPFLQATIGDVPVVPVLIGHGLDRPIAREMARALSELVGPETLIVVSSDFTHHGAPYGYDPFRGERELDDVLLTLGRDTANRCAAIDPRGFWDQIEVSGDTVCGARPIAVLLELLAHRFQGSGTVVDLTTSGHVSDNWNQVVTYAAVSFAGTWTPWREVAPAPPLGMLTDAEKRAATSLARATLETHLTHKGQLAKWFAKNGVAGNLSSNAGVFVTLSNRHHGPRGEGKLRGCIGVIEAHEPLVDAIVHAAQSAAHDPRFPELGASELDKITVEVSALSPTHQVPGPDAVRLGTHGVILGKGGRRAVFLPQVATETGWDLATFLSQLSLKAGLAPDAWKSGATFEVFTAQVFGEEH